MNYKIYKNDNGTASCVYKFSLHSNDLIVTYVPSKDYYMIETAGPHSARWIVPSDLLDALYNAGWEIKETPNADGVYYCPSHDYKNKQPCLECQLKKKL